MDSLSSCKILIFEDDTATRSMLNDFFAGRGATVATAEDGKNSLERINREQPDLLILDVIMPFQSGLGVLREMRAAGSRVPVLMLTEKGTVEDRVTGLELGADDYLAKPFDARELLARARVLLRQARQGTQATRTAQPPLQLGCLRIDPLKREVEVHGCGVVSLTKTEFDLFFDLARHVGAVRPYAQLMQEVLGYDPGVESRALSVHIANIRRKFEDISEGEAVRIRTLVGIGYTLVVSGSE
ncbi:MAG: response regulator transcription factor [Desulfobulbaceae bacterium]|nr:response regulator transcription factor [Desulfobulbaceae bacterium]